MAVIGRLKSEALPIEYECVRFFNVAKLESFLLNRHWSWRLPVLGGDLDRDDVLTLEVGVARLSEILLDAGQEVAEHQNRVEPHLGQS